MLMENKSTENKPRVGARMAYVASGVLIVTGLIINPWVGSLWRSGTIVNYREVMLEYFLVSITLGIIIAALGAYISRTGSTGVENLCVLIITISLIIVADRLALVYYGRSPYMADKVVQFRLRPNVERHSGDFVIKTNRYGYNDDDFPEAKGEGEFRGVALGDSLTMAHGVKPLESYPRILQDLLNRYDSRYKSHKIINTGVSGYGVNQEYHMFDEALKFKPDFAMIGFCINDVTEPFVINRDLGGVGIDYQDVLQTSNWLLSYLFNETGFGIVVRELRKTSVDDEKVWLTGLYDVTYVSNVKAIEDYRITSAWKVVKSYCQKVYDLSEKEKIPLFQLIFPFPFQFLHDELKAPQKILSEFARSRGVEVIDLTPVFEKEIFGDQYEKLTQLNASEKKAVIASHIPTIRKYFIDTSAHMTPEGHRIAASHIFEVMKERKIVRSRE
jgi:hypothetical protein